MNFDVWTNTISNTDREIIVTGETRWDKAWRERALCVVSFVVDIGDVIRKVFVSKRVNASCSSSASASSVPFIWWNVCSIRPVIMPIQLMHFPHDQFIDSRKHILQSNRAGVHREWNKYTQISLCWSELQHGPMYNKQITNRCPFVQTTDRIMPSIGMLNTENERTAKNC